MQDFEKETPAQHSARTEELRRLVRIRRRGFHVYALPNLLTSANLLLGYMAILFAADGKFIRAAWAILFSSVFDLLDGRIARLTNTTSKFGVEYDSLCDLVSFGVAPSILLYYSALKPFGRAGMAAAVVFALCGALRLARFNVLVEVVPKSYFMGLPIPIASATLCTSLFFADQMGINPYHNLFYLGLTAIVGVLMVTTIKFPSFKDFSLRGRRTFSKFAFIFITLILIISWFEIAAFVLFLFYIFMSVLLHLYRSRPRWKRAPSA